MTQVDFVPKGQVILLHNRYGLDLIGSLDHFKALHEKVVSERKVQIHLTSPLQKRRQLNVAHLLMEHQIRAQLWDVKL